MLKGKWRKLKYLDVTNLSIIPHILVAACVLHNYVVDVEGDEWYDDDFDNNSDDEFQFNENESDEDEEDHATALRNRIAASL